MTESELFTLIKSTLTDGMTARNIAGVTIEQGEQPFIQGAPNGMALLLWKVNIHPYGYPKVTDVWQPTPPAMIHTEQQIYEATIQCTGSVKQPPPSPTKTATLLPYTAGDLCKIAGRILQSAAGLAQLQAGGCGVQRIAQIPQAYFKDESDRFAQNPHFDFVLTFTDTEITTTPIVTDTELNIIRV